jgi:hypothetical protein
MEAELESGTMSDSGTGISQSGMESDFLDQYQLVDEKTGEPIDEGAPEPEPVPEPKKPEPPKAAIPGEKPAVTDYTAELYNEDGTLDVQKAMALFSTKEGATVPELKQQPVVPVPQPKQQTVPVGEPADPMVAMRKNALAAIDLQRYYMEQGYDASQAMAAAERDIDEHLRQHFLKSEMQKMREEFGEKEKALREEIKGERELAIAEPVAERNLLQACHNHAKGMNAETLRKSIFDINLGGQFLSDLFVVSNPDKEKLTGEPLAKAMNDWFVKCAAKNPRFVESLAINAVNQIQKRVYPEMAKMIQQSAVARQGVKKATQPGPRTPQNPAVHNSSEKSRAQSELDVFLGNAPRTDSRPHI